MAEDNGRDLGMEEKKKRKRKKKPAAPKKKVKKRKAVPTILEMLALIRLDPSRELRDILFRQWNDDGELVAMRFHHSSLRQVLPLPVPQRVEDDEAGTVTFDHTEIPIHARVGPEPSCDNQTLQVRQWFHNFNDAVRAEYAISKQAIMIEIQHTDPQYVQLIPSRLKKFLK